MSKNNINIMDKGAGKTIASTIRKLGNPIAEVFMWFGSAFLIFITVITVVDIFTRFFFRLPVQGAIELVELTLVCVTFSAIVYTTFKRGHVKVDVIIIRLSKRTQYILESIMIFIGAVLAAILCWQLCLGAIEWMSVGRYSATLMLPIAPFKFVAAVCAGIVGLFLLVDFIRTLIKHD